MELNRAQLLVHNDEVLDKFRVNHGIFTDVQIKHSQPNEDANLVEGHEDYISFRTGDDGLWSFLRINDRFPDNFNDQFKCQSEECRKAIHAVDNRRASRSVDDIFEYKSIYRHVILHKAEEPNRICLPPLCIEGRAPQRNAFSLKGFKAELNENIPSSRVQEWEEGVTSSSSSYVSLDFLNIKEEEVKEDVNQLMLNKRRNPMIRVVEPGVPALPISILSSDNENSNNLAYAPLIKTLGQKKTTSTANPPIVTAPPVSQYPPPTTNPILALAAAVMGVTMANTAKDGNISLTLAQAVMLPKDVTNLAEESSDANRDLLVMQQVQDQLAKLKRANKKVGSLESELNKAKLALVATDQLKADLAALEQAQDTSYTAMTQAQNDDNDDGVQRDKALQDLAELQAVTCGHVYKRVFNRGISLAGDNYDRQVVALRPRILMEGWLACLTDLGIPEDNPTWSKAVLAVELLESSEPCFPMILPSFNEEDYMNQPAKEDGVEAPENEVAQPTGEVTTQPAKEVEKTVAEEVGEYAA
ncbi:hypothetical protein Acr_03g0007840 [Actinidia rufa]|uniref:Uncharacterized protein n=1 Tax=Actinidia rufa TaxID=165716 RepID=A0A7J0EC98_9ERIC|nr:hypothetical protein Acr_03g0007840 [Actinidia rufa]